MIYILAGSHGHAKKWAATQMLADDEWFSTLDVDELNGYQNFHVIVLDSAAELSPIFFEKIFNFAHLRGRINR